MANKQNDKLRLLLRRFEMQKPPPEFTGEVMKEIESMADDKVYADTRLVELLQKGKSAEPSPTFTYKVLNKVREQPRNSYPPIISKRVWISIVAFVVFCLIVSITNEPARNLATDHFFLPPLADYLGNLVGKFIEQQFILAVIFFSITPLLAIDYYFRKKLRRSP